MARFENFVVATLTRLPGGPRLVAAKDRLSSFGDQFVQGVANLAMIALLARSLDVKSFASISMMTGINYFAFGLHRGTIVLPFIVAAAEDEKLARASGAWWWASAVFAGLSLIVLAAITGLMVLIAGRAHNNIDWAVRAVAYATITAPAIMLAEFGRRWRSPGSACCSCRWT